jgi:hypothetical protein
MSGIQPDHMSAAQHRTRLSPTKLVYLIVAFALAAVLLYFSLRGIQWKQVWATLSHAKARYVGLWIVIGTISLFLRAVRWRILLCSGGQVSVPTAFWATAAGYFGNNFLPARAGELIRTLMVSAKAGLSKMFVFTTALSERLADAVTLVLISSIVLLTLPALPGWFAHAARPFAALGILGILGIALTPRLDWLWRRIVEKVPFPHRIRERINRILDQVLAGLRAFHDKRRLFGFLALTAIIWFCDAIGIKVGMYALGFHISIAVCYLLITGLGLGSALPSTPGYVGIYQFVAVSVLTPFGFSKDHAIAFILLSQGMQYVGTAIWGLLALAWARDINLKTIGSLDSSEPPIPTEAVGSASPVPGA